MKCGSCISFKEGFTKGWCDLLKKEVMATEECCSEWDTNDIDLYEEYLKEQGDL